MSTISEQSRRIAAPARIWVARMIQRRWQALLDWQVERAAIAQLSSMSDHELKDIGLRRSEISEAVKPHTLRNRRVF